MNKYLKLAVVSLLVVVLYNIFDYVFSTFITHNGYQFTAGSIGIPAAVAIVMNLSILKETDE